MSEKLMAKTPRTNPKGKNKKSPALATIPKNEDVVQMRSQIGTARAIPSTDRESRINYTLDTVVQDLFTQGHLDQSTSYFLKTPEMLAHIGRICDDLNRRRREEPAPISTSTGTEETTPAGPVSVNDGLKPKVKPKSNVLGGSRTQGSLNDGLGEIRTRGKSRPKTSPLTVSKRKIGINSTSGKYSSGGGGFKPGSKSTGNILTTSMKARDQGQSKTFIKNKVKKQGHVTGKVSLLNANKVPSTTTQEDPSSYEVGPGGPGRTNPDNDVHGHGQSTKSDPGIGQEPPQQLGGTDSLNVFSPPGSIPSFRDATAYHTSVDLSGFQNENISLDLDGRRLIIVAYRGKTKDMHARKVTEIIDIPEGVNLGRLSIGRRQDGSLHIEETVPDDY